MNPILSVEKLRAGYGQLDVLFDVGFSVGKGEALALMGRNGMGKTTTIRAITGLVPVRGGSVVFDGEAIVGRASHRIAKAGIGLVPEGRRCFGPLTVRENLIAAARLTPWSEAWTLESVTQLFPRLGERMEQRAATLSGGEQQMLSIGRALMTNPKLLVLDEATEGLAPVVRREIRDAIISIKASGLSILIIDKSVKELKAIADRIAIIEKGSIVWTGPSDGLDHQAATRLLGV